MDAIGAVFPPELIQLMKEVLDDAAATLPESKRTSTMMAEMASQILSRAGKGERNPATLKMAALSGVVELFEDVISDPGRDGASLDGPFAGLPFLMKDLGPTMKGRLQEMGSLLMRGNRATADTFLTAKMRSA